MKILSVPVASPMPEPVSLHTGATVAVIVTYHPDLDRLVQGLDAVRPQVDAVVVVDNGSPSASLELLACRPDVQVLPLGANLGIGAAQNRGIAWARARGAAFVLLLDQDSVVAAGMVTKLHQAYATLNAAGERVGALGPVQVDASGEVAPRFTRYRRARYLQVPLPEHARSMECDMLIASGTLIPMATLDDVGVMDASLFIDKVDTEWCLRVKRGGWSLYGVADALLYHRLGESTLSVPWWRGKRLPVHKPFRYYFMVRNSVLMHRMRKVPWSWRLADLSQVVQIILFHGLLAPNARENRPMILRGLRDGLLAVHGPMPAV